MPLWHWLSTSPRSRERGPIEATIGTQRSQVAVTASPRSRERGPIEALFSAADRVKARAPSPRSRERGPIEASTELRESDRARYASPRSRERGPIEARSHSDGRACRVQHLRAHVSAAPLKQCTTAMSLVLTMPNLRAHVSAAPLKRCELIAACSSSRGKSPRSRERGPIEAIRTRRSSVRAALISALT